MAKLVQYSGRSTGAGAGSTQWFTLSAGSLLLSSGAETTPQRAARTPGSLSNLFIRVNTNATTGGTSTFTTRKNTASGNQTVSFAAGVTGTAEDTTHSDNILSGDLINGQVVVGTGGSITPSIWGTAFIPNNANTVVNYLQAGSTGDSTASTTFFSKLSGPITAGYLATETTELKFKSKASFTRKNMNVNIASNARSSTSTYGSRLNTANGGLAASVGAGVTGNITDTSGSDTVVSGDLINNYLTLGTGGNTIAVNNWDSDFVATNSTAMYIESMSAQTYAASVVRYECLQGRAMNQTTELVAQSKAGVACTASQYEIYLSANTIVGNGTVVMRKGGATVNGSISVTGLTTGWFEDTSNSDVFLATDLINWQINAGATGTSMATEWLACKMAFVPSSQSNFFIFQ